MDHGFICVKKASEQPIGTLFYIIEQFLVNSALKCTSLIQIFFKKYENGCFF
jgi:hypothetical protein